MNSKIFIGDSRDILKELHVEYKDRIALLVTSPPYYVGRGYEAYLEDWIDYWAMIESVMDQASFLIEPYGKMAINFADKYANYKEFGRALEICYATHYSRIMAMHDLYARIIWDKLKISVDGAKHINNDRMRLTGQMRVSPNWEYIFVWRKRGEGKLPKKNIDMTRDEWKEWVNGIWRFSSVSKNTRITSTKLAIFPEELPRRLIKIYTQPGDIIIDPFVGTGTTIKVARQLGRIGIGIEKNIDMLPFLRANLQDNLFSSDSVEFIEDYNG